MARSLSAHALIVLAPGFTAAAALLALVLPSSGEGASTAPERRPDLI